MTHTTGSVEDARDVVQDAFVQAFVKLESFAGRSGFYTWLYRIAFNVAATRRRRARPQQSLDGHASRPSNDRPDTAAGPDHRLAQQEQAQRLQAALKSMNEEY